MVLVVMASTKCSPTMTIAVRADRDASDGNIPRPDGATMAAERHRGRQQPAGAPDRGGRRLNDTAWDAVL
jgi:hypothetical protein